MRIGHHLWRAAAVTGAVFALVPALGLPSAAGAGSSIAPTAPPVTIPVPVTLPPVPQPNQIVQALPLPLPALPLPALPGVFPPVSTPAPPAPDAPAPTPASSTPTAAATPASPTRSSEPPSRQERDPFPEIATSSTRYERTDLATSLARTARSYAPVFALVGLVVAFLVLHGRVDRHEPKLAAAPIDDRREYLEFA